MVCRTRFFTICPLSPFDPFPILLNRTRLLRISITVGSSIVVPSICPQSFNHSHSLCTLLSPPAGDMPVFTTMSLRRAIQASILLLVATTTAAQSCYFPDGTLSPDTPCTTSSGHTSCCGSDALCLDNGLCFRRGILSRGSCTDKDWESDACAGYCRTGR